MPAGLLVQRGGVPGDGWLAAPTPRGAEPRQARPRSQVPPPTQGAGRSSGHDPRTLPFLVAPSSPWLLCGLTRPGLATPQSRSPPRPTAHGPQCPPATEGKGRAWTSNSSRGHCQPHAHEDPRRPGPIPAGAEPVPPGPGSPPRPRRPHPQLRPSPPQAGRTRAADTTRRPRERGCGMRQSQREADSAAGSGRRATAGTVPGQALPGGDA